MNPNVSVTLSNPFAGRLHLDSKSDFERVARGIRAQMHMRYDAGLTAAFARQLEHVFTKIYAAEFAAYRAREFFPVSTEVESGALSFTYRMIERIGQAAVINHGGNAKDLPNIDVGAQEWPSPVITLGASYNFTVIDQQSAAMAQIAIEAEKGKATREAIAYLEEQIFALGFANAGVPGVVNVPGIVATTKLSTGTWGAQLAAASAQSPLNVTVINAIANDIIAMKQQIVAQTFGRHTPTNLLLPFNLYTALDTFPESPLFNNKTLLGWLQEVTQLDFDMWPILINAGGTNGSPLAPLQAVSGGNPQQLTRVLCYEKNPEVIQLIQAQTFTQLPPQPTGLVWEVPCFSRIGGAMSVRPLGMTYMDGC